jgi:hypothetical protein
MTRPKGSHMADRPSLDKYLRKERTSKQPVKPGTRTAKRFTCAGIRFATEADAKAYAERLFRTKGVVVGIEVLP